MEPIQEMARAHLEEWHRWFIRWTDDETAVEVMRSDNEIQVIGTFPSQDKAADRLRELRGIASQRAALLALAECELPDDAIEAGAETYSDAFIAAKEADQETINRLGLKRQPGAALCQTLPATFRAMLRSIASAPSQIEERSDTALPPTMAAYIKRRADAGDEEAAALWLLANGEQP